MSILISGFTLFIAFLAIGNIGTIAMKFKKIIFDIRDAYLATARSFGKLIYYLIILGFTVFMCYMLKFAYTTALDKIGQLYGLPTITFTIFLFLFAFITFYFLFGIPLLVMSKLVELINSIKNTTINRDFILSFSIIIMYSFFLISGKSEIIQSGIFIFIGLAVSYYFNMKILFGVIMDPLCFFHTQEKLESEGIDPKHILRITLAGAVLLLALIIVNLYFGVLMVYYTWPDAFYCSVSTGSINEFNLFYYTIVTFTTIGYGDIVPNIFQSKIISLIIAFTSVLCLVIFIGSAISVKDRLKIEEKKLKINCQDEIS